MKKIYINPGHCDKDPGAVGYETERRLNVAVSGFMADYLQTHYDCQIRMNPGTMHRLAEIAQDANDWGADLFVSNHFNAAGGDGYEGYIYSEKTMDLGKLFAAQVEKAGQNLRRVSDTPGVIIRPTLAVLRRTHMPAILTEGAFVDNLKDISDWNEDQELQKLAAAYAQAAAQYLGMEQKKTICYRVQVGAYREKENALAQLEKIRAAGFPDAFIQEGIL